MLIAAAAFCGNATGQIAWLTQVSGHAVPYTPPVDPNSTPAPSVRLPQDGWLTLRLNEIPPGWNTCLTSTPLAWQFDPHFLPMVTVNKDASNTGTGGDIVDSLAKTYSRYHLWVENTAPSLTAFFEETYAVHLENFGGPGPIANPAANPTRFVQSDNGTLQVTWPSTGGPGSQHPEYHIWMSGGVLRAKQWIDKAYDSGDSSSGFLDYFSHKTTTTAPPCGNQTVTGQSFSGGLPSRLILDTEVPSWPVGDGNPTPDSYRAAMLKAMMASPSRWSTEQVVGHTMSEWFTAASLGGQFVSPGYAIPADEHWFVPGTTSLNFNESLKFTVDRNRQFELFYERLWTSAIDDALNTSLRQPMRSRTAWNGCLISNYNASRTCASLDSVGIKPTFTTSTELGWHMTRRRAPSNGGDPTNGPNPNDIVATRTDIVGELDPRNLGNADTVADTFQYVSSGVRGVGSNHYTQLDLDAPVIQAIMGNEHRQYNLYRPPHIPSVPVQPGTRCCYMQAGVQICATISSSLSVENCIALGGVFIKPTCSDPIADPLSYFGLSKASAGCWTPEPQLETDDETVNRVFRYNLDATFLADPRGSAAITPWINQPDMTNVEVGFTRITLDMFRRNLLTLRSLDIREANVHGDWVGDTARSGDPQVWRDMQRAYYEAYSPYIQSVTVLRGVPSTHLPAVEPREALRTAMRCPPGTTACPNTQLTIRSEFISYETPPTNQIRIKVKIAGMPSIPAPPPGAVSAFDTRLLIVLESESSTNECVRPVGKIRALLANGSWLELAVGDGPYEADGYHHWSPDRSVRRTFVVPIAWPWDIISENVLTLEIIETAPHGNCPDNPTLFEQQYDLLQVALIIDPRLAPEAMVAPPDAGLVSDQNCDGVVDTDDLLLFVSDYIDNREVADINLDGIVDVTDVVTFVQGL
jgi:hypothetical protein